MNNGDWSSIVQVVHASANLNCPVDENVWWDPSTTGKNPVQRSTDGVLHDEAEFGWSKTDTSKGDYVWVIERPEKLGFLQNILAGHAEVEFGIVTRFFHCNELTVVKRSFYFTETT